MARNWTDDDIQTVKDLWKNGCSGGECAAAIGNRHSRSSILGLMRRSGLSRNGYVPEPVEARAPQGKKTPASYNTHGWNGSEYRHDAMWDFEEARRRMAFADRAAKGAREARKAMEAAQL